MLFLSIIFDRKTDKNSDKFIICYCFQVKIHHKTIILSFCVIFASLKFPRHDIRKNNYRFHDTIFFVIVLFRFVSLVKKSVTADPWYPPTQDQTFLQENFLTAFFFTGPIYVFSDFLSIYLSIYLFIYLSIFVSVHFLGQFC